MARIRDKGNVSLYLSGLQVLSRIQTPHYRAVIYLHKQLGRVLVLNDEIQHVEAWAPLYHEPLVHLAAAFVERPQTALLLGGGSLFAARELLRYRKMKRVLMIDHDPAVIEAVTKLYEQANKVRGDPRLEVSNSDAFHSVSNMTERFDLIINDSVDLFRAQGPNIFEKMGALLRPGGVCSDVVYRHVFEDGVLSRTIRLLRSKYHTALSLVFAPEYPGVLHLLTLWSKSPALNQFRRKPLNVEQRRWAEIPHLNPCGYFDPRFLSYYLHLPRCIRDRLNIDPPT